MSEANLFADDVGAQVQRLPRMQDQSLHPAKLAYFFLLLFTAILYGRPEDPIPVLQPLHIQLIIGMLAGVTYLLARLSGKVRFIWTRELTIVLALTAWYAASVVFSYWKTNSLHVLLQVWLKTLFIFFLFTQTVITLGRVRKVLWVIILCELVVAGLSILRYGETVIPEDWGRFGGIQEGGMLAGNFLGITIGMTVPYMAALLVVRRSLFRLLLLVATFALVTWAVVLTASRSGLLSVGFSLVLTWLLVLRGSFRSRAIGFSFGLVIMAAILFAPQVAWERLATVWGSPNNARNVVVRASAEESRASRSQLLQDSIEYTLERPIFGWGLGNFQTVHGVRVGKASAWLGTHNTFTQISSEAGIPALLLFLGLLMVILGSMRRVSKSCSRDPQNAELGFLARATAVSISSLMFAGLFAHLSYEYYLYYVVGIAVSLRVIAQNLETPRPVPLEEVPANLNTLSSGWAS